MAISIVVTDGTSTVTLSATDGYNTSYQPQVPDKDALEVTETLEVTFFGGNATVAANLAELEQMLDYAREAQKSRMRRQVWLKVTIDSDVWRSEIYDGKIVSTDAWIKYERALGERKTSLILTRAPWFEADSAIYASLTNIHGTQSSAGLILDNHNDGSHDNYGNVTNIIGDIPAPAIVTITTGVFANTELFMGVAAYSDQNALEPTIEMALNADAGVTVTPTADATSYSGTFMRCVYSGASEIAINKFYPTTADLTAFAGRVFRPLIRFGNIIGGTTRFWLSLAVSYDAAGTLEKVWQSEETEVELANKFQILPPLQLPPWPIGGETSNRYTISVQVRCEAAGSHTLDLDALEFLPCDSFLRLIPIMTTYPNTNIEFDTQTRILKNDGNVIETHAAEGPGIWLVPGPSANRFVLLEKSGTEWYIAIGPNVKIQYRPRKRSL